MIVMETQKDAYFEEHNQQVSRTSSIARLDHFLVTKCLLLRVNKSNDLMRNAKSPFIPRKRHTATLIVRFYHETLHHKGRHFTEDAKRTAGLW